MGCVTASPPRAAPGPQAAAGSSAAPVAPGPADWPDYGGDPRGQRFSPVSELDAQSLPGLSKAFTVALGPAGTPQEDFPLEDGGVLYLAATGDRVLAVDAGTGRTLWSYDPGPLHPPKWAPSVTRGVGLGPSRVYLLTADDRLIALDRTSGRPVFTVQVADPAEAYFESMAPLVTGGAVIIGSAGGDEGARGFVAARDATDGHLLWNLYTVPAPGEGWMAADGFHGGGVVWTTPSEDPGTGLLFVATGNPSPDYFGLTRPGPDPNSDAILAVDAATGALRWAEQEVPHDLWDYDAASPPVVFPLPGGEAVGEASKDGQWSEWDEATGASLFPAVAFVKVDHSPPTAAGVEEWPGPDGGANYGPTAYNPNLHLAFVAGINGPERLYSGPTTHAENTVDLGTAQGQITDAAWTGTITAIDVRTGGIRWQIDTATPPIGGTTATAGNLVLFGQENGELEALSATDGKVLWHQQAGAPIASAPIVYRQGGTVYVAVVTGGAGSLQGLFPSHAPGQLVAYRLGPS